MICIQLRFPLGVYHALTDRDRLGPAPEWVPSPVRLVGALLAAAHEVPSDDTEADREVLQRLCDAGPPVVHAPVARPAHEQAGGSAAREAVAELRGASRWAPRNPSLSELKVVSPRIITWSRTAVDKGGVAIGDFPVAIAWPNLDLGNEELGRLQRMASDIAWLGTSRSPVIANVVTEPELGPFADSMSTWSPLPWDAVLADAHVRVPSHDLLERFDRSFDARRSRKSRVEQSGHQRPTVGGDLWPYAVEKRRRDAVTFDPRHWGRLAIVALDEASEMAPRTPSTYLMARAFRAALMDVFEDRDSEGDAPAILHGHGDVPHLALVPLPFAGHEHADGSVKGFALVYPHTDRLASVSKEAQLVEAALLAFFPQAENRRQIDVPGSGSLLIRQRSPKDQRSWTLSPARYVGPSRAWVTVTPVVHSRWAKDNDVGAYAAQLATDCRHVGLPEPKSVEFLRTCAVPGGATRLVPGVSELRPEWRSSFQGPRSHLRLEFDREIVGPLLLGRARHFGVGLLVPIKSR